MSQKRSSRKTCVAGRVRHHRTGKCATAEDFTPVEIQQFLILLGIRPTTDHKENMRLLRSAVKPDRFNEVAKHLAGVRSFGPAETELDIFEERGRQKKQHITAAERVGHARPIPQPPVPPTPLSFVSVSPVRPADDIYENAFYDGPGGLYSPSKVTASIYEDDDMYDWDDDVYEDEEEEFEGDEFNDYGYVREQKKKSVLSPGSWQKQATGKWEWTSPQRAEFFGVSPKPDASALATPNSVEVAKVQNDIAELAEILKNSPLSMSS